MISSATIPTTFPLAAVAGSQEAALASIIFWASGLIVLVVLMWVGIAYARKRMSPTQEDGSLGFTLADLRDLHKRGAMSDEEFERAKAQMVQVLKTAAATKEHRTEKTTDPAAKPPPHSRLK
jgi:uncharacterized membrane protein